ncbi:hypothetical protein F5B20DRAFT_593114 [Whalleya microplaca]|nr:hypothetical protein F5B20DRAFT_593114 [Whalleya microplaca]
MSISITLSPTSQGRKWQTFRTPSIVCLGLSGLTPPAHRIYLHEIPQMIQQSRRLHYLVEQGFVRGGVYHIQSKRPHEPTSASDHHESETVLPEQAHPETTFAICSSPRRILCVLVLLATAAQLLGILSAFSDTYDAPRLPTALDNMENIMFCLRALRTWWHWLVGFGCLLNFSVRET